MTGNNLPPPPFTSEDLTPGEKPYTPSMNGLTSIRQLSSRTPLMNVTNTYANIGEYGGTSTDTGTEDRSIGLQRKGNKRKQNIVWKTLFHDTPLDPPVSSVDYENIETSAVFGFSDSEVDSEATESDKELHDCDAELVRCLVPPPLNVATPQVLSWAEMKTRELPKEYKSLGAPKFECNKCGAQMWKQECSKSKGTRKGQLKFNLCCYKGRVTTQISFAVKLPKHSLKKRMP